MSDTTNDPQREWFRKRRETHPKEDLADRIEAFASTTNKDQQPKYSEERRLLKSGRWSHTINGTEQDIPMVYRDDPKAATAPLLSLREFDQMCVPRGDNETERIFNAAASVMEFFEAKIASGELMVCKTATLDEIGGEVKCSACGWSMAWEAETLCSKFVHCPGCTSKITEG